ncbi:MAG: hypothetical protein EOP62_20515 [Sphingomonadales bacterium]|nr:MAG: hypothetical protein EOP62_20515 [Sphingomonadales bacterium]
MFILALALAGVTAAPAPDQQRAAKRVRVTRVAARARPGATQLPIVKPASDPDLRYRLTDLPLEKVDGKDLAVRDTGMACETTGAPVCPSSGTTLVKTPIQP